MVTSSVELGYPSFDAKVYSVEAFMSLCRQEIAEQIPVCWVEGEISNLYKSNLGHCYFSLKDERATMRCAFFKGAQSYHLDALEEGQAVLVRGAPTIYARRGDFQLVVQSVEVSGLGNLYLAFTRLKKRLAEEGLFAREHKKALPRVVKHISVVTSAKGSVLQDILTTMEGRYPPQEVRVYDTLVQGESAAFEIARTIERADTDGFADVIIVARGGGSIEDLWAFNEEVVARAVFAANTPVVSAIGHETDTTIIDFVSDESAVTPTAAAVLVTRERQALLHEIAELSLRISEAFHYAFIRWSKTLDALAVACSFPTRHLNNWELMLARNSQSLTTGVCRHLSLLGAFLERTQAQLMRAAPLTRLAVQEELNQHLEMLLIRGFDERLAVARKVLLDVKRRLVLVMQESLSSSKQSVRLHTHALDLLSPLQTLDRGYAIVQKPGAGVVTSVQEIELGAVLTTRFGDGEVESVTKKIRRL